MGSREGRWVLETDPTVSSSSMQLPPEQLEKTRHPLSGTRSNISSQHPSPCVSRPSKIPIPRLSVHNVVAVRPRVKKACKECRDQKTKCDGYQPCSRYVGFRIDCIYVYGKKESQERRLQDLERQVQVYEKLLRQLQLKVMPEDEELIARALTEFSPESTDTATDHGYSQSAREDLRLGVEYVQEDFHSNKRLQRIGFIGGPSEMSWVRDLNRAVEKDTEIPNANTPDQSPSDDLQALSKFSPRRPSSHTLVPQHLVQAMEAPMVYFSRAQRPIFTGSQLIDHPDLRQVQVEGLTAFLCITLGHINRYEGDSSLCRW
ncbi:hypothetical protein BDV36DRAFT_299189 [Aspergillus pseudocaelatus]|uniref:Zn(2)-C6 fungal-type domain-containing protein n=1 Tax=Aspergillus pseudocaelatus TaxID=1825620 RepID=A0ABQ6WAX7_9EURO|nr:hypothetical protein BDV36DRAFT_299189 [Aspergillus pseudocaelatus]